MTDITERDQRGTSELCTAVSESNFPDRKPEGATMRGNTEIPLVSSVRFASQIVPSTQVRHGGTGGITCDDGEPRVEAVAGRARLDGVGLRRVCARAGEGSAVGLVDVAGGEGEGGYALPERRFGYVWVVRAGTRQRALELGREAVADADADLGRRCRPRERRRVGPRPGGEARGRKLATRRDGKARALRLCVGEGEVVVVGAGSRAVLGGVGRVRGSRAQGVSRRFGADVIVGYDAIGAGSRIEESSVGLILDPPV